MTAKRFRVNDLVKYSYSEIGEYLDENHTDNPLRNDEVVELLNELHEENQRLKQQVEDYIFAHRTEMAHHRVIEKDLKKENEQLKQRIKTFIEMLETEKETAISKNERIRLDFAITVLKELEE